MSVTFEVRVAGRVVASNDKRDVAIRLAMGRKNAEVWCVSGTTRTVEGTEMILPEKDRARGTSAHLKGSRSKFVTMRGPGRSVEARVW